MKEPLSMCRVPPACHHRLRGPIVSPLRSAQPLLPWQGEQPWSAEHGPGGPSGVDGRILSAGAEEEPPAAAASPVPTLEGLPHRRSRSGAEVASLRCLWRGRGGGAGANGSLTAGLERRRARKAAAAPPPPSAPLPLCAAGWRTPRNLPPSLTPSHALALFSLRSALGVLTPG